MAGIAGQRFRMQAGVGQHRVTLGKLTNGGGAELVRLRHGAGRIVGSGQIAAGESRLVGLVPRLRHRRCNPILHFRGGLTGEGMAEVLHNVQPVSAPNHT